MEQREAGSVGDAWNKLYEDCRDEYGDNPYNGTFSTCDLVGSPYTVADMYSPASKKKGWEYVHDHIEDVYKRCAKVVDLGVSGYIVRSVARKATHKEPPKYQERFQIICTERDPDERGYRPVTCGTKAEADKKAKEMMLKDGLERIVAKKKVLVSGTDTVTEFTVSDKRYKSKPHLKNMEGRRIIELHQYIFYGWAAE